MAPNVVIEHQRMMVAALMDRAMRRTRTIHVISCHASPFADLILHKTGHGLGLNVHEAPHIMIGSETALEPGMVFTVEPGLYRHGSLGVCIEDDIQTTSDGCISLTTFDRSLPEIG